MKINQRSKFLPTKNKENKRNNNLASDNKQKKKKEREKKGHILECFEIQKKPILGITVKSSFQNFRPNSYSRKPTKMKLYKYT